MSLDKQLVQGQGMTSLRTRQRLIERLTEKGIADVRILEAMRDTPRHLFLDEALSTRAYESLKDRLTIGGKLIIPVGDGNRQVLTLVKRTSKSTYIEEKLEDVLFVPLLKGVVS